MIYPTVIHSLPGRTRIKVPGLKNNPGLAGFINENYRIIPGITGASASPVTCTALFLYDGGRTTIKEVLINLHKIEVALLEPAAATSEAELKNCPPINRWPEMDVSKTLEALNTHSMRGLHSEEASRRLALYGPNRLAETRPPGILTRIIGQMKNFLVQTLLGSSVVCALMGEAADSLAIISILGINAVLGAIQESKAEGSLNALKEMASPTAKVVRNGGVQVQPADRLVPGDVVILEQGDGVPADLRLIEAFNLETEESALTGESNPVSKSVETMPNCVNLIDCNNMVFMGTSVVRGRSKAVAVATGLNSELGKIASMLNKNIEEQTPLQQNMNRAGTTILKTSLIASGLISLIGLLRGGTPAQMFLTGVSLAVAAIPEGLPAIITVAMASGVHKMAKSNAIVKKLSTVETIGGTTVICTDKTGTLTRNEQTVKMVFCPENQWWYAEGSGYNPHDGQFVPLTGKIAGSRENLEFTLTAASLCCDARLTAKDTGAGTVWKVEGDPSEGAILAAARKAGIDPIGLKEQFLRVHEDPFDPAKRRMCVICKGPDNHFMFVKGSPDTLLPLCSTCRHGEKEEPLTGGIRQRITDSTDLMAGKAMRVLAVAYKRVDMPRVPSGPAGDSGLVFLGLVGMMDPPRPEVAQAIKKCRSAGIKVKMITGDHPFTALAIGRELGLADSGGTVLTGRELDRISEKDLDLAVRNTGIFARILPEHKLRLVQALKKQGEIVAMIGDGVNDAPAVKEATVGVAMGMHGTDVTRQAADIILTDDNFSTVVTAVEQGRGIYGNLRKSVRYLLATNAGEVLITFLAVTASIPIPLLPIQFLWLNLLGDGLPAVALGVDSLEKGLMRYPPQNAKGFFDSEYTGKIIRHGAVLGLTGFGTYWLGLRKFGLPTARTMTLGTITLGQLLHALEVRKDSGGTAPASPFLNVSLGLSAALLLGTVYWPPAQRIFKTTGLGWQSVGYSLAGTAAGYVLNRLTRPARKTPPEHPAQHALEPIDGQE